MSLKQASFTASPAGWRRTGLAVLASLLLAGAPAGAQSAEQFRARLSQAPPLGMPADSVRGSGAAEALLVNQRLEVSGSFTGLTSPATTAYLYWGPVTGVRGDAVFELTVTKTGDGAEGGLAGAFALSPAQVDAVRAGQFYIQLHSEGAPNGHLIGWLLR